MVIVMSGAPGTGKSTHGRYIARSLGFPCISAGAVLRQVARRDKRLSSLLAAGDLAPSEAVDRLMHERLSRIKAGFVLDGYPRKVSEAKNLLQFLGERSLRVHRVYELRAPESVIMERLLRRRRDDDRPDVIRERLRIYRLETEPVLRVLRDGGAEIVEIDTSRSIEEVQRDLDASLDEVARSTD
jgi:adenylate kinase